MNISTEDVVIIYTAILYIAGVFNVLYALALFVKAFKKVFRALPYRRAAIACGVAMLVFGMAFFIHVMFSVRLLVPTVATVISLSAFHIGALLFAYAYLVLLSPESITRKRKVANIAVVAGSVLVYWAHTLYSLYYFMYKLSEEHFTDGWPEIPWWLYAPFFIHALYLAYRIYTIYIRTQRDNPDTNEKMMHSFMVALPRTVNMIIICGIGTIAVYCVFPEGMMIYTILMFLAYFAFYFVYRAMINYGKSLVEEGEKKVPSKWQQRIKGYNLVYHTIILVLALGVFYIFSDNSQHLDYEGDNYSYLNLSKHAYWDNPNFDEGEIIEFGLYMYSHIDPKCILYLQEIGSDSLTYERCEELLNEINKMPDSYYKALILMMAKDGEFSVMPKGSVTAECVHDFVNSIYELAHGDTPVPQRTFMLCWENAMDRYVDANALDSVKKEADRLLTICRKQNIAHGIVSAYSALGTCLEKEGDYEGAAANMEVALDALEKSYTEKYGKNWRAKDKDIHDLLYNYNLLMARNANYRIEYADTIWFKEHIDELEAIEKETRKSGNFGICRNLYYALASYHDQWGDKRKYEEYIVLFKKIADKCNDRTLYGQQLEKQLYSKAMIRHHLRNNEPAEAMKYIDSMPEVFQKNTSADYAEALLQLGRYEEAAEWYKQAMELRNKQQNGRTRNILVSMSSGVREEYHRMEVMQAQLRYQQTRLMYNSLLIFVLGIMIGSLVYFLMRQHRLNKELSQAMEAEERARKVRDIFLSNMTHEFHTPLNTLYGFSQILADPNFPIDEDSVRDMASEMVKASEHTTKILDNIIEVTDKLSKLEDLEEVESILMEQQEPMANNP